MLAVNTQHVFTYIQLHVQLVKGAVLSLANATLVMSSLPICQRVQQKQPLVCEVGSMDWTAETWALLRRMGDRHKKCIGGPQQVCIHAMEQYSL